MLRINGIRVKVGQMSNRSLPPGLDRGLPVPALERKGTGAQKKLLPENPCNPLISLDSDERIQGNPRKSNSGERRLSQPNSEAPRKSKSTDGAPAATALKHHNNMCNTFIPSRQNRYWQSARAFAVHAPKPLAIMLRMTEQT